MDFGSRRPPYHKSFTPWVIFVLFIIVARLLLLPSTSPTPQPQSTMAGLTKFSTYTLNNGAKIPICGFGVYHLSSAETTKIVYEALKAGYRHIDSARFYDNEREDGIAIAKFLEDYPEVKRSDIFFTSKINNFQQCSYEKAKRQLEESYQRIKDTAGYFDLFLIHSPYPDKTTRLNQYRALQDFVDAGKIKSIGVSNFGTKHLDELYAWEGLKYKPVVNQLELHPWLPRKNLQAYAKKYDHLLEAYSPLTQARKFHDPDLVAIAKKHGKTPAQILLRWSFDQGFIPIAKTATASRLPENFNVLDHVELDDEDRKILDKPNSYEVFSWDPTTNK